MALGDSNGSLEITQLGFESGVASISKDVISKRSNSRHRIEKLIDFITLKKTI